jgi:hypothetical protein
MTFYPDIHYGQHKCDTYLGPCPGPKPEDYVVFSVREGRMRVEVNTHYVNHGNTWQSCAKYGKDVIFSKYGTLVVDKSFFNRMDKNIP